MAAGYSMKRGLRSGPGHTRGIVPLVLGLLFGAGAFAAEPVDYLETWCTNGPAGWELDRPGASLTNGTGHLLVCFGAQPDPVPSSGVVEYDLDPGISVTNLSFRFLAQDRLPSSARLYLRSAEVQQTTWYVPLTGLVAGAWVAYSIPVRFGPQWKLGPTGDESRFLKDVRTIAKVGIYVRRHGARSEQRYGIDDFRIQGIRDMGPVSIAGVVSYAGTQGGPVRIAAVSAGPMDECAVAVLPQPAAYEGGGLGPSGGYRVSAYRDSNDNAQQDFWEASGAWTGGVVFVSWDPVQGIDIQLAEPCTADGMPLWWLRRYFGITAPEQASQAGCSGADDPDRDGMTNYGEYRAGTDPGNPLSRLIVTVAAGAGKGRRDIVLEWASATNRTYAVHRGRSLPDSLVPLEGGVPATPPLNVYRDTQATNAGPYFYRVFVEE